MTTACLPRRFMPAALFLSALLIAPSLARPDSADNISPGTYQVGFTAIEKYDFTRTFRSPRNYFGEPISEPCARPVQISLWYPAESSGSSARMVYSEYTFPYPNEPGFFGILSRLQDRETARLQTALGGDDRLTVDLMASETGAVRDAPWAGNSLPLIIYCGDIARSGADNAGLWENLASHGYVVASFPSLGTATLNPEPSLRDIETLARDIEFVYASLTELPHIDRSRVAVAGTGLGAQAALLVASRNRMISSVVLLFGGTADSSKPLVCGHPGYDRAGMTVPVLAISGGYELLDSCRFADRLIIEEADLPAGGISHSDLLVARMTDTGDPLLARRLEQYEQVSGRVRQFLDWRLRGDATAGAQLAASEPGSTGRTVRLPAEQRPPTAYELLQLFETRDVADVSTALDELGLPSAETPLLPEAYFNQLGYQRLQRGEFSNALVLLRWATRAYPQSANAWDSYAEVALIAGDSTTALAASRRALELLPDDQTTPENMKAVLRQALPARIQALESARPREPH